MSDKRRMCIKCRFMERERCLRFPPVAVPRGYHNITDFAWPTVRAGDWCGEFRSIPTTDQQP